MDNITKIDLVDIELNRGSVHRSWLNHSIGSADAKANAFGVRVFRDGQPVTLSGGSVQGYFRDSQGNNIALTSQGTISGNAAYVTLPQACYNYDGQFTLAIKLINSSLGITGTMRIVDGMVDNTNTGSAVAPTGTVPTYQEVLSVYENMVECLEDFDEYKDGIDAEVDELKSDLTPIGGVEIESFIDGKMIKSNASPVDVTTLINNSAYKCSVIECSAGDVFTIRGTGGDSYRLWCFINSSGTILDVSAAGATENSNKLITAPNNTSKLVVNIVKASNGYVYKGIMPLDKLKELSDYTHGKVVDIEGDIIDLGKEDARNNEKILNVDNGRTNEHYLLPLTFKANTNINNSGEETPNDSYCASDFVYIPFGCVPKIETDLTGVTVSQYCYDKNKSFITRSFTTAVYYSIRYIRVTANTTKSTADNHVYISFTPFNGEIMQEADAYGVIADLYGKIMEPQGDSQIFNWRDRDIIANGYSWNSSLNIVTSLSSRVICIEVNGSAGDAFLFKFFPNGTEKTYVIDMCVSDTFINDPAYTGISGSIKETGTVSAANKRGYIITSVAAKYVCVRVQITDGFSVYTADDDFNKIFKTLVVSKIEASSASDIHYPDNYIDFYKYDASINMEELYEAIRSLSVLKNQGSVNANKILMVDASGCVTLGENPSGIVEQNPIRYYPTRTLCVGEDLITNNTEVELGTGWSGSLANGFTHTSGNTDALIIKAATTSGKSYIIDITLGVAAEASVFLSIGDKPLVDVYNGYTNVQIGIISDGGYLKITPASGYSSTVSNIAIREVVESGTEIVQTIREVTHGSNIKELTGFWNVVMGANAMSNNENGSRNIAIGFDSLMRLITGTRNICIGTFSMPFVTDGDCNVAIGADTIYNASHSTGSSKAYDNVAIGKATMANGDLVRNNVAIGRNAMSANDGNAENNVAIGMQSGVYAHNRNVFVGKNAGYYTKGNDNTCLGYQAGSKLYHTGSNNIFIGTGANPNVQGASSSDIKTVDNALVIGAGAEATGSNQIVLGNAQHSTVKIAGKTIHFNNDGTVTWD